MARQDKKRKKITERKAARVERRELKKLLGEALKKIGEQNNIIDGLDAAGQHMAGEIRALRAALEEERAWSADQPLRIFDIPPPEARVQLTSHAQSQLL